MSHSQIQAVGWILLTGFIAVSINTIVRYLSDDFHAFQLVFFYSFLALAFYMPSIWSGKLTVKTDRTKLYFLRSALEFVAFSLLFFGLTLMPLPVHTSLSFTSPLFGSIAAIIFLREPNSLHRWIALGIGFVGVLVITRPGVTDFDVSGLIVLAAAMCFSLCGICIKKLTYTEPSNRIAFYMVAFTSVIAFPFALYYWNTPTMEHFPYLVALGILVASVQYSVSQAFSKADVTIILPFFFVNLLWSSIYAYFVFDEVVDEYTVLGGAIIINAALYAARNARKGIIRATEEAAVGN